MTKARRTQAMRRSEAEEAMLDAAARLFARKGVEATSLADICTEAGFSRGLANHHFGSRAALVERLARRAQRGFQAVVAPSRGGGIDAVVAVVDGYLRLLDDRSAAARSFVVMWGASFAEEAALRPTFVVGDDRFRRGIEVLVHEGQAAGSIRADADASGFATVLVAVLRGVVAQHAVAPDAVDMAAARAVCVELIHCYLGPV
ncbi:MAG: TetR/AcrR family transcriptional regulator [Ilumatobacteraceae bacterium]